MTALHTKVHAQLERYHDQVMFSIKHGLRRQHYTGAAIISQRNTFAKFLSDQGYSQGDRYIIWGANSPEWVVALLAGIQEGYVAVPVDARSNWSTIEGYIEKTVPKFAIISRLLVPFFKAKIPVYVLEDLQSYKTDGKKRTKDKVKQNKDQDTLVEILFTSGSSGSPKGVMISEGNILAQMEQTLMILPNLKKFETVSILPLSHIYEQMYGLFLPILSGGTVHYIERMNPLTLQRELRRSRSTYLLAVPQILRVMYDGILRKATDQGKQGMFEKMIKLAAYLPFPLRRKLFSKVHQQFGSKVEFITSGSAPLEPKLAKRWEAMGFKILEGYGATETTGLVSVLPVSQRKFGTVGQPSHHSQLRLSNEGEIQIKGPIVSSGYYQDKEKNAEAFTDGWYKTGDVGIIDPEKFLQITGRISSRIVLSDGTKVYPEDIERMLNNHPSIKESCVCEKKVGSEVRVHAWVIFQATEKKPEQVLEGIVTAVNSTLESKQQIYSSDVWTEKDFPRLRTRKVDRNAMRKMTQQQKGEESTQTKDQGQAQLNDLETILRSLSEKKKIKDTDMLGTDLKLDSLRRIQLTAMVEQYIGVQINDFNLNAQTTVAKLKKMLGGDQKSGVKGHSSDEISEHWKYGWLGKALRGFVQWSFLLPANRKYLDLRIEKGKEILENMTSPSLIIVNHPGVHDVSIPFRIVPDHIRPTLAAAITEERWEQSNAAVATFIELTVGGYPIGRKGPWMGAGLEATGELVDKGFSIVFAPEGEMQREWKQKPFLPGLGYLIKELRIPVIMVKINADDFRQILPPPPPEKYATDPAYLFPRKRGEVRLRIGTPKVDTSLSTEELTRSIERQFNEL